MTVEWVFVGMMGFALLVAIVAAILEARADRRRSSAARGIRYDGWTVLDFHRWPAWLGFDDPMLPAWMYARNVLATARKALHWRSVLRDGRMNLWIARWSVGTDAERRTAAYADLVQQPRDPSGNASRLRAARRRTLIS